ncbi:15610_t:CDS:2 [Acaulospora colombiana]|uniref:15610_t:CDS:1 n=1 Tax=Acaulospora colombiana TaxID=27376 RepID=A0ACA9L1U9_9GLOM|nr:15610_t:CDS:2 [Acaulospora colombiana]
MDNRDTLLRTIASFPLIDNHAHNLLTADTILSCPLEVCFSEARGEALKDAIQTSSLKQGVRILAKLYRCAPSWEEIKRVRDTMPYDDLCKISFETTGIQSLLLDDGIYDLGALRDIKSHLGLVEDVRRILRIESVAESILRGLVESINKSNESVISFAAFEGPLRNQLKSLANSKEVVAFKSIAAYRSGLNINCNLTNEEVAISLGNFIRSSTSSTNEQVNIRLAEKVLIDHVVNVAVDVALESGIPIQFHTGLGDNDLDLLYSNPLHLRPLIEKYKDVKIVLLHASYPYTRQAAYLASVYANVYVDVGLVNSLISSSGQQATLRELALLEYVDNGDFTVDEAMDVVKQNKGVKLVRVGYLDNSSQLRFHIVPINRFRDYVAPNGLTSLRALTALPYFADVVPKDTGVSASGECIIKPDLNTLLQLPYYPEHSIVLCFFENKWTPVDPEYGKPYLTEDSKYFALCPRNCLRRIVNAARQDFRIGFLAGCESEFVLLKTNQGSEKPVPVDETLYLVAASFRGTSSAAVIDKIVDSLSQLNIVVEQCHSESAYGQFEVVTGPSTPLTTADNCVLTRNTIYDVASQFGLKATFVSKPFDNQAGTGAHLHISFHDIDKSEKENDGHLTGLSPYERSFIAGVLHHIKAICAFALPTVHSYTRTVDHCWAGSWICWGVENRETPIRVCYRPKKSSNGETTFEVNFEHKFVDATSNPYLVMSAIIAAGLDGMKKKMELNTPPCLDDPASLTEKERKDLGIVERMPRSLRETLDALKNDKALIEALGEPIVRCYVGVKETTLSLEDSHPTYITPAPYVFGVWGLIHLLLLGFIIYQFFPKADTVVVNGIHWHFLFIALLISLSQSLYDSDYLIIAWIILLIATVQASHVYFILKNRYPSDSTAEMIFIHFPFSLLHAWTVVLSVIGLFAAFTSKEEGESPGIFVQILVAVGLIFLEVTAVGYIEKFKGDIAGAIVIDWALYGVAVEQDDTFIRFVAIILAVITTLHILKALIYDRFIKKERAPPKLVV